MDWGGDEKSQEEGRDKDGGMHYLTSIRFACTSVNSRVEL